MTRSALSLFVLILIFPAVWGTYTPPAFGQAAVAPADDDVPDMPEAPAAEPEAAPARAPAAAAEPDIEEPAAPDAADSDAEPAAQEEPEAAAPAAPLRPNIGTKPYLVVPVDDAQKRERNNVMGILRNQKFEAGQEEAFDNYYRRYFLPRWTQPSNISSLPLLRRELRNNLLMGKTGPPHTRLNAIILDYMGKMAKANVHPAARVNAMLMIGELNELEPVRAGDAPVPLSAALPVLLNTIDDQQQIDPVKVAALVGVTRHAQFGRLTPEATTAIQRTMIQLASSSGAPARSADGHAWMRALAAKTLGLLGSLGENGAVPRLLASLVQDQQLDMLVRCQAAAALGNLNYGGGAGLNVSQLIGALGQLAADAIGEEAKTFEDDPESFSGRRIKGRLVAVRQGLVGNDDDEQSQGISPLATGENQRAFAALRSTIDDALTLFDDKQMDDADLVEKLQAAAAKVPPAGAAPAAP